MHYNAILLCSIQKICILRENLIHTVLMSSDIVVLNEALINTLINK